MDAAAENHTERLAGNSLGEKGKYRHTVTQNHDPSNSNAVHQPTTGQSQMLDLTLGHSFFKLWHINANKFNKFRNPFI